MHLNMSYSDIRAMPVRYRKWFLQRLSKHYEKQSEVYNRQLSSKEQTRDADGFDKFNEMINKKFS